MQSWMYRHAHRQQSWETRKLDQKYPLEKIETRWRIRVARIDNKSLR